MTESFFKRPLFYAAACFFTIFTVLSVFGSIITATSDLATTLGSLLPSVALFGCTSYALWLTIFQPFRGLSLLKTMAAILMVVSALFAGAVIVSLCMILFGNSEMALMMSTIAGMDAVMALGPVAVLLIVAALAAILLCFCAGARKLSASLQRGLERGLPSSGGALLAAVPGLFLALLLLAAAVFTLSAVPSASVLGALYLFSAAFALLSFSGIAFDCRRFGNTLA